MNRTTGDVKAPNVDNGGDDGAREGSLEARGGLRGGAFYWALSYEDAG